MSYCRSAEVFRGMQCFGGPQAGQFGTNTPERDSGQLLDFYPARDPIWLNCAVPGAPIARHQYPQGVATQLWPVSQLACLAALHKARHMLTQHIHFAASTSPMHDQIHS